MQGPDSARANENDLAKRRRQERERLEQMEEMERLENKDKSQQIMEQVSKTRSGSASRPDEVQLSN